VIPAFSDSHIHAAQIENWKPLTFALLENGNGFRITNPVCASAHSAGEFETLLAIKRGYEQTQGDSRFFLSFGVHPQNPDARLIDFLEMLVRGNKIDAVGEAGFDFFTDEYAADTARQKEAWNAQLACASRVQKPLVIHCRKALHMIFADTKRLQKIPRCVFHSFAGSLQEARSLLKRGVNAYFSFGKPLLNGNKRAILCVKELPLDRLLAETDAPFQRLKDEARTEPRDILRVHQAIAAIKDARLEHIAEKIAENFFSVFAGGSGL
jgi:TatD DNase family protein